MVETQKNINVNIEIIQRKNRQLIPWWIKGFSWLFIIYGILFIISICFWMIGYSFYLTMYGMVTSNPISKTGIILMLVYFFKAIIGYGLLKAKKWAIILGIVDSISGIFICIFQLSLQFLNRNNAVVFTASLELLIIIFYLVKLIRIKSAWLDFER